MQLGKKAYMRYVKSIAIASVVSVSGLQPAHGSDRNSGGQVSANPGARHVARRPVAQPGFH